MQNPSRWLDPPATTLPSISCPLPSHLCTYWPFPPPPPPNPLEPILQTLLSAAQFTLSTPIHSAAVTVYGGVALTTETEQHVHTALSKLGIHTYGLRHVVHHLLPALEIASPCTWHPEFADYAADEAEGGTYLIFSAEFTHDSLTALLWEEECGYPSALGYVSSPRLGLDFLTACRESGVADEFVGEICFRTLRASLRRVAREASLPPTSRNRQEPKPKPHLNSVLLYGESATHADIVEPLREVLSGEFANGGEVEFFPEKMREFAPEPAFAGSRAAAHAGRGAREWERGRGGGGESFEGGCVLVGW